MEFRTVDDLKKYLEKLEKCRHHPEDYIFGIEIEGALVDKEGKPLSVKEIIPQLNRIYQDFDFGGEAGACQLEIRSPPRSFSPEMLREKEEYLMDAIEDIVEIAEKVHKTEAIFLLLGANPHPEVLSDKWISDSERARKMAEWRSQFPDIRIANRIIRPEHIALAIQSIHIHIQGKGPQDVADKFNRLLYMIPEHIALAANSPVIGGEVVDYAEARLLLYEMADGGNAGLPKLKKYPIDFIGYGEYVASFKPILAKTLTEMIKERHEDNRIRFEIPFRVENRVCATQCTIRENMALIEYIIGRLKYAQRWSRQAFPSLKEIEINRIEAIKNSIRGKFIWGGKSVEAKEYLLSSIEKAEKGIRAFNIRPRYLHILKRRVEKRKTSADIVKRWFRRGDSEEERIAYLVNRIWEHTRKNKCII
ncbi:MAG: hypothetical protein J7L58_02875 [Thermoplasmata archaeon]|nr:hypothetical protein [Thermoplasmata archaeon]